MTRAIRRQNIELRNEFNSCGVATTVLAGAEFPTDGAETASEAGTAAGGASGK